MARVAIKPVSRSVSPGSVTTFSVRVEEGDDLTVSARPCEDAADFDVRIVGESGEGPDAKPVTLAVSVPKGTSMA